MTSSPFTLPQAKQQFADAVTFLTTKAARQPGRTLFMPGDGRYQPAELKGFLGYDQMAGWLVIVEWFWMVTLAHLGEMPAADARLLNPKTLEKLLTDITNGKIDAREKITKHDILALLELMREHLPKPLHRWLHFSATSYDIVETAYALQIKELFARVFYPQAQKVDRLWRGHIRGCADIVQAGRTHLQTALPVTVGAWLAVLHNRFAATARQAASGAKNVPGKFSGAVGTKASQTALLETLKGEQILMNILGLPAAAVSTQIVPPEAKARFYFELVLLSGSLANLGEDVRILQSSQFGEITSASSSSSAMPHKTANPIAAEQLAGMHVSVQAEFFKIMGTLVSDLGRDLRWSNVLRSYSAVIVYTYQQLNTAERLLKTFNINVKACRRNFDAAAKLVVAELLHLYLQRAGFANTHELVNTVIVPAAAQSGVTLAAEMDTQIKTMNNKELKRIWENVPALVRELLDNPDRYIGQAKNLALREAKNELKNTR